MSAFVRQSDEGMLYVIRYTIQQNEMPTSRFALINFLQRVEENGISYCIESSMCQSKVGGETWS